jgi:hypothetical protein
MIRQGLPEIGDLTQLMLNRFTYFPTTPNWTKPLGCNRRNLRMCCCSRGPSGATSGGTFAPTLSKPFAAVTSGRDVVSSHAPRTEPYVRLSRIRHLGSKRQDIAACVPALVTREPGAESNACVASPHSSWLNLAMAVYASRPLSPVATQHSLPSGRYSLPGPDFHRLDRASFAWRLPLIRSPRRRARGGSAER